MKKLEAENARDLFIPTSQPITGPMARSCMMVSGQSRVIVETVHGESGESRRSCGPHLPQHLSVKTISLSRSIQTFSKPVILV